MNENQQIEQRVLNIIKKITYSEDISLDTDLVEDLGIDAVDIVDIIINLQDEFDIYALEDFSDNLERYFPSASLGDAFEKEIKGKRKNIKKTKKDIKKYSIFHPPTIRRLASYVKKEL